MTIKFLFYAVLLPVSGLQATLINTRKRNGHGLMNSDVKIDFR